MNATGMVEAYTDGACRGNPGPGGWGAVLRFEGSERELSGYDPATTNNRMELTAAIEALSALKRPCRVRLVTDSKYLVDGLESWLSNWKSNGWKTAGRKPVKNVDLWRALDALMTTHEVTLEWVKGHAGHPENERADLLANQAIDRQAGHAEEACAGGK